MLHPTGIGAGVSRLVRATTRSISAENPTGEKAGGARATDGPFARPARDLGLGWKVNPFIIVPAQSTVTLADITGPGIIQHIWITASPQWWRRFILRMYWDGEETPSVEVPLGDFFCNGWCQRCAVNSLVVAVHPAAGLNAFWEMPFGARARITLENVWEEDGGCVYQITYTCADIPADLGYLHAHFRRSNPLPYKAVHTLVDGIQGHGHYVGTYLAWQANSNGWWGEGEIKFYLDGDDAFPTICGTGTEDYIGGSHNFEEPGGAYGIFSGLYSGLPQVIKPDGLYVANQRFGMYRWHLVDPIRFEKDLRVTIQALGWRAGQRYLPLQDDIASTAYWYQSEPHAPFPPLPDRDALEVITGPGAGPDK
jgi:hypothetical protein